MWVLLPWVVVLAFSHSSSCVRFRLFFFVQLADVYGCEKLCRISQEILGSCNCVGIFRCEYRWGRSPPFFPVPECSLHVGSECVLANAGMARVRNSEPSRFRAPLKGGSWSDSPSFVQLADVWAWETLQNVNWRMLPGCSIHVRYQWLEPMLECHVAEQRGLWRESEPFRIRALANLYG